MRGGYRKGAGAKPLPPDKKKKAIVIWLPSDMLTWLDGQEGNRGEVVRYLIEKERVK